MIYFIGFLTLAVVVAALWFLVRPLVRSARSESTEEYFQLTGVRDRLLTQLNELDLEERDRNVDRDTAADERARLEAGLAQTLKRLGALTPETAGPKTGRTRSKRRGRAAIAALAVVVPAVAVGVYMINVTVSPMRLAQAATMAAPRPPLDPREMVARLEARLQQNPGDFAGWVRLGRSYSVLGSFPDSKKAYARAYALMPKDYKPDTPDALLFLGFAAADAGHTQRALQYWNTLLTQMPPDSAVAQELKRLIEQTKSGKK